MRFLGIQRSAFSRQKRYNQYLECARSSYLYSQQVHRLVVHQVVNFKIRCKGTTNIWNMQI